MRMFKMLKYSWNIFGKSILETETNTKVGIQKFRLNLVNLLKLSLEYNETYKNVDFSLIIFFENTYQT